MKAQSRIVVTGAAGHLGSHIIPLLLADGYDVIGVDMVAPKTSDSAGDYEFIQLHLSERKKLPSVFRGSDLIVHTASLHPWKEYTDEQYLDANVKSTWQLYDAAVEAGVRKIVMTSSIAAVGYHHVPVESWPVTEEMEFSLGDLYSYTKHAQESAARLFAYTKSVRTFALRPPAFMPQSALDTGFALTGNFAVVDDIAGAHLAAAKTMLNGTGADGVGLDVSEPSLFTAFFIVNKVPYRIEDIALLGPDRNAAPLLRKYWPDEYPWLVEHGYEAGGMPVLYDISKAERMLGWKPKYNFEQWAVENIKE